MALTVQVAGQPLVLLAERAAFLPACATLLVADAHFGKAQSFRRQGVPVPAGTTARNLATLSLLLARTGARTLVFLGDLLHARHAHTPMLARAFVDWRARHAAVAMTLVRGNHDDRAGDPPAHWGIDVVDEPLAAGAFALRHHPEPVGGHYVLAGHLHPAAWVGQGPERLRLPCFHFAAQVGVLPAFGGFTGMHPVRPQPGERIFVVADDVVRALPVPGGAAPPGTAPAAPRGSGHDGLTTLPA
jgi:DNA ligase-associated metallophosphoesterase